MPRSVGRRGFSAQDIEIAVARAYFVKGILWAVPLVKHLLNHVLAILKPTSNRPFVRRPSGVRLDIAERFWLDDIAKAHEFVEHPKQSGRVVVVI